ncbi:hypothetical protein KDA11_06405 [Candidatus Saccharibacteria bacterium]|nr:hypothetical protein [Candidatus Saccharibacteria bacterium]
MIRRRQPDCFATATGLQVCCSNTYVYTLRGEKLDQWKLVIPDSRTYTLCRDFGAIAHPEDMETDKCPLTVLCHEQSPKDDWLALIKLDRRFLYFVHPDDLDAEIINCIPLNHLCDDLVHKAIDACWATEERAKAARLHFSMQSPYVYSFPSRVNFLKYSSDRNVGTDTLISWYKNAPTVEAKKELFQAFVSRKNKLLREGSSERLINMLVADGITPCYEFIKDFCRYHRTLYFEHSPLEFLKGAIKNSEEFEALKTRLYDDEVLPRPPPPKVVIPDQVDTQTFKELMAVLASRLIPI